MEQPARTLRSLALFACSCLLLNLPSIAQTNAGPSDQPRQSVLQTAFDTAAIQKALAGKGEHEFYLSGWYDPVETAKAGAENPKVCATPLLESKADAKIDPGIRTVLPKQDQADSGVKTLTDKIAVPPPLPACPPTKR
jgi:hypothetical protein